MAKNVQNGGRKAAIFVARRLRILPTFFVADRLRISAASSASTLSSWRNSGAEQAGVAGWTGWFAESAFTLSVPIKAIDKRKVSVRNVKHAASIACPLRSGNPPSCRERFRRFQTGTITSETG